MVEDVLDEVPRRLLDVVVDFTRYDLPAVEPAGSLTRSWNLMNVLNMKGSRPQDTPTRLQDMGSDERALIGKYFPELVASN